MEELLKSLERDQRKTGKNLKQLQSKYEVKKKKKIEHQKSINIYLHWKKPLKDIAKGPEDLSNSELGYSKVVKYGPGFSFSKKERLLKKVKKKTIKK